MSKALDEFSARLESEIKEGAELDRRKKALQAKELDLKEKKVDVAFEEFEKNKEETEKSKSINFGKMSPEACQKIEDDNADYLEAAKHPMPFICSEFDSHVPFFRKNLVLIAAASGAGKSTAVSNIVNTLIRKRNPVTKKPYRVLVLTNEEAPEDFLNQLTCFAKGWRYANHDKFTDDQRKDLVSFVKVFTQEGPVTVVGDEYEGVSGWTTTVEGIVQIFNNLIRDKETYDVVLLDYYQNVTRSRENPELNEYQVQRVLAHAFDRIKNVYRGCLVVMAQIDPVKDEEEDPRASYRFRFTGTKLIINKSTFFMEIIPKYKLLRSDWIVHKSRSTDSKNKEIVTGFDRGRFVPYSKEYQLNIAKIVADSLEKDKQEELGLYFKDPKEDEQKEENKEKVDS
jgi:putative ribosome biogenesis GTPase RsgA